MNRVLITKEARRAIGEMSSLPLVGDHFVDAGHFEIELQDEVLDELWRQARPGETISDLIIRKLRDG